MDSLGVSLVLASPHSRVRLSAMEDQVGTMGNSSPRVSLNHSNR
jgi:hypothetical protein